MRRGAPSIIPVLLTIALAAAPVASATRAATTAAEPPDSAITSPRIRALARALADGDGAGSEPFWLAMAGHSPLVEQIPDEPSCSWVTFVWRGDSDTRRVGL